MGVVLAIVGFLLAAQVIEALIRKPPTSGGTGFASGASSDDRRKGDNVTPDHGQQAAREIDTWSSFDHTHHHSHDHGSPF